MRPYEIFREMPAEHAVKFCGALADSAPNAYRQCLALASAAIRARPVFLRRRPLERQAEAVRRALARVASNEVAEEMLAVFFLECRRELLVSWLDAVGVAHENGVLQDDTVAEPQSDQLREAVAKFLEVEEEADRYERRLLLLTFAAQSSIEWPTLDALLANSKEADSSSRPPRSEGTSRAESIETPARSRSS
jgi:hypothetical protein